MYKILKFESLCFIYDGTKYDIKILHVHIIFSNCNVFTLISTS